MDIAALQNQVNERWGLQEDNPCHRCDSAEHALLHMTKALGKVASALNDWQHSSGPLPPETSKYLADLVICAARFAGLSWDLDRAVEERLAEKFPIKAAK